MAVEVEDRRVRCRGQARSPMLTRDVAVGADKRHDRGSPRPPMPRRHGRGSPRLPMPRRRGCRGLGQGRPPPRTGAAANADERNGCRRRQEALSRLSKATNAAALQVRRCLGGAAVEVEDRSGRRQGQPQPPMPMRDVVVGALERRGRGSPRQTMPRRRGRQGRGQAWPPPRTGAATNANERRGRRRRKEAWPRFSKAADA